MKRLPLTPQLIADIQAAVGADVEVNDTFAVFESISLNTLPLPGKRGSIFERATVSLLTLKQMVDSINNGNHLPLIHGHMMDTVANSGLSGNPISLNNRVKPDMMYSPAQSLSEVLRAKSG